MNKQLAPVALALRLLPVEMERCSFNHSARLLLLHTNLLACGYLLISSLIPQKYVLLSKPKQFCIHKHLSDLVLWNLNIGLSSNSRGCFWIPSQLPFSSQWGEPPNGNCRDFIFEHWSINTNRLLAKFWIRPNRFIRLLKPFLGRRKCVGFFRTKTPFNVGVLEEDKIGLHKFGVSCILF